MQWLWESCPNAATSRGTEPYTYDWLLKVIPSSPMVRFSSVGSAKRPRRALSRRNIRLRLSRVHLFTPPPPNSFNWRAKPKGPILPHSYLTFYCTWIEFTLAVYILLKFHSISQFISYSWVELPIRKVLGSLNSKCAIEIAVIEIKSTVFFNEVYLSVNVNVCKS